MRKLVLFMHTSLDGFVATSNKEIDWININEKMFRYADKQTNQADTALYGRVTFELMDDYWPTAAEKPNATSHDVHHSHWYNNVEKVVASRTMKNAPKNVTIISENIPNEITKLKQRDGKNIIVFGSPTLAHTLMQHNLIDDYWLFVNPLFLGKGISLFNESSQKSKLKLVLCDEFSSGVIALHYEKL